MNSISNSISISQLQLALKSPIIDNQVVSTLEASAILILLREHNHHLELVLTRRAYHLNNHPGQICFAGGRKEIHDKDLIATAIREAHEEIGLPPESVEILGEFNGIETISGFLMTPIVGFSQFQGEWKTDPEEVHSMLTIPLDWAMEPNRWRKEYGVFRGTKHSYLTAWWQGQLIWGATAQILHNLSNIVNLR